MSISSMHDLPTTFEEGDGYRSDSVLGPVDRDSYSIHKHRKTASTGGGRAWTEEEESYLLRTRSNKMPYKHIAAHLHKTELACRLHYHQMSYGSNRRKRNGSISSTCSSSSFTSTSFNPLSALRESSPERTPYTHLSPVNSPPSSPESMATGLAACGTASPAIPQRPILPKPVMSSSRVPMLPSSVELSKALQLDTSFSTPKPWSPPRAQPQVDVSRLRAIYAAHRDSFWSHIASQYSSDSSISATELEDAFFHCPSSAPVRRGSSPPTPGPSPQATIVSTFSAQSTSSQGFSAINQKTEVSVNGQSPTERCAVSGLLN